MKDKLKLINNIPFAFCLTILLLNDFYFKATYHNWLTGKLSDFCGLFVFALFWEALIPTKKRIVYIVITLLFVIWKSPSSQVFIDFFSQYFYSIHRVVDFTDLIALLVLPVAFYYNPKRSIQLKLNPIPLAVLSAFSFCATSIQRPSQKFEQPQYLLFKSETTSFRDSKYPNEYTVHKLDSLTIIDVKRIGISEKPRLNDEFHKVQILKELELLLLREAVDRSYFQHQPFDFDTLLNALIVDEFTSVRLDLDSITDHLSFRKTRLDGSFKRFSSDQILIIDGQFKNGVEDSIWTFYQPEYKRTIKKHFNGGELIKTQLFENTDLISTNHFNTRAQTIKDKHLHLFIIFLLIIGALIKLYLNFRKSKQRGIIQVSNFIKIAGSLTLPIVVLMLSKLFSSLIPNSYSVFFIDFIEEGILIYLICTFLFLVIFYGVKLRDKFDWVYYSLLFSLSVVLVEEWAYLQCII